MTGTVNTGARHCDESVTRYGELPANGGSCGGARHCYESVT